MAEQPGTTSGRTNPHDLTRYTHAFKLKDRKARKIKLSIKRVHRWGTEQKIIRANPFQFLKVPQPGLAGSVGEYYWGGAASTLFFVSPKEQMIGIIMSQFMPMTPTHGLEFRAKTYESIVGDTNKN